MTKFSVFTSIVDRSTNHSVPVGIVVWSPEDSWHKIRLLQPDEHLAAVKPNEYMPYLRLVEEKIANWVEIRNLPYSDHQLRPFDYEWWLPVRKLLNHEIHLSVPKEVPQPFSKDSVEALFLSVVAQLASEGTTKDNSFAET